MVFFRLNKSAHSCHLVIQFVAYILLFVFLLSATSAQAENNKNYLRIERSLPTDKNDLTITSIGGLIFEDNTVGHIDLTHLESDVNGKALALDAGGGYVLNSDVSLFVGLGISLGYNWTNDDYIAAYYPEAGITIELTKTFGITLSAKRYFNLYDVNDNVIKFGLLFMN